MILRTLAPVLALGALQGAPAAPERAPEWVAHRVQAWQPTEKERAWEKIGWAGSIREALALAKQHNRPVFLFTLDGKMAVGRC